jgi:hypothetical protein
VSASYRSALLLMVSRADDMAVAASEFIDLGEHADTYDACEAVLAASVKDYRKARAEFESVYESGGDR